MAILQDDIACSRLKRGKHIPDIRRRCYSRNLPLLGSLPSSKFFFTGQRCWLGQTDSETKSSYLNKDNWLSGCTLCCDDIHWNHYNDGSTSLKLTPPSKVQSSDGVAPNVGEQKYLPTRLFSDTHCTGSRAVSRFPDVSDNRQGNCCSITVRIGGTCTLYISSIGWFHYLPTFYPC